jgi:excisionase family DNA binding protein
VERAARFGMGRSVRSGAKGGGAERRRLGSIYVTGRPWALSFVHAFHQSPCVALTDQQLLTVEQIASEFQLTSQTIRNWIKSGALSAVRIGHVYRVRREDVDAMMRRHQGETAPLGTHRDLWAPETLGMPYRRHEDPRQPSIWDGTSSSITPSKRA